MDRASDVIDTELPWDRPGRTAARRELHLVLAWSLDEPHRLGESIALDDRLSLGRGAPLADDPAPRAAPVRMRPAGALAMPEIANARISRLQLLAEPQRDGVLVRSVGRARMHVNGRLQTEAVVRAGDVIELHNAATFLVSERPTPLSALRNGAFPEFAFAGPDPFGMIGESEAAWRLRDALCLPASTERHVLLLGDSGAGKELAARTIHGLSARRARPLLARNAATLPEGLLDAELFGNVKGYPNPGMPERAGLIGEADGSTLFLDEIAELPERLQTHLLRVLDSGGEYQRLGDAKPRRSSFRLIAATNRGVESLKHDLLARFTHRVQLLPLNERRDDIPLLIAELLRKIAAAHPAIEARFFERRQQRTAEARLAPELVTRLLRHQFTHNVRELERLLWLAISSASEDYIGVTPAVEAELRDALEAERVAFTDVDRGVLIAAIAEHGRSPTRLAQVLGLKNRYVLIRLLKKHGLATDLDNDGGNP